MHLKLDAVLHQTTLTEQVLNNCTKQYPDTVEYSFCFRVYEMSLGIFCGANVQ